MIMIIRRRRRRATSAKALDRRRPVVATGGNPPGFTTLFGAALVVAAIYFGRDLFVPVVLAVLLAFVLAPVVLILINSLKTRESIFDRPFDLPLGGSFSLAGYELVFGRAHFPLYFLNSIIATLGIMGSTVALRPRLGRVRRKASPIQSAIIT